DRDYPMEVIEHSFLEVQDASQIGSARRIATDLARRNRLAEPDIGRVALIVTELASNVFKHGGGGGMLLRSLDGGAPPGLQVVASDRGRGIANLAASMRDGFSTAGTTGTGLGAISRLSDTFDVYSSAGGGTVVLARVGGPTETVGSRVGVIGVPKPGEEVSGD